jgi:anti-anti-sigma factor
MCERVVLISAVGKINAIGARDLGKMIDRVLVARNLSRLVIDLTRVTHFSKREVDALLHARELALRTGIELRVVTAGRLVDDVLRKRHATDMFHLSPDVDGACI